MRPFCFWGGVGEPHDRARRPRRTNLVSQPGKKTRLVVPRTPYVLYTGTKSPKPARLYNPGNGATRGGPGGGETAKRRTSGAGVGGGRVMLHLRGMGTPGREREGGKSGVKEGPRSLFAVGLFSASNVSSGLAPPELLNPRGFFRRMWGGGGAKTTAVTGNQPPHNPTNSPKLSYRWRAKPRY